MPGSGLTALVLAGGQSRRFGQDKALLELDGQTLLERACNVVGTLADEVVVVGRVQLPPVLTDVRSCADHIPGLGPLGGLYTGLQAASYKLVVAVACDLPYLSAAMLRQLIEIPSHFEAGVARWHGQAQPLAAVYRRSVLPAVTAQIESGDYRLERLLDRLSVWWLDEQQLPFDDPYRNCFTNINWASDWQQVLQSSGN